MEYIENRNMLEKILKENVPDISNKNIWIWGAGDTAQLYQEGFKRLKNFVIQGYVDNNSSKIGRMFNGKPVISPVQLEQLDNVCVLLCSIRPEVQEEVGTQLNGMQIEWHLIDEVILKLHQKEVMECFDSLYDEKSKDIYANLIIWRITGKRTDVKEELNNDYFALSPFVEKQSDEVFVDCGAWRGDVVERYVEEKKGNFRKIIAFEPDNINFEALEHTVEKLKKKWNLQDNNFKLCLSGVGAK